MQHGAGLELHVDCRLQQVSAHNTLLYSSEGKATDLQADLSGDAGTETKL